MLCLHLLAVSLWVDGMVAMHFAMRPASVQTLQPPLRLPFRVAAQMNAMRQRVARNLALGPWVSVLAIVGRAP